MFNNYDIDILKVSNEDKKKIRNFLELIDKYAKNPLSELDELNSITHEELSNIFGIAKSNQKLQMYIWRNLPDKLVNDDENLDIFEKILDEKFGDYIQDIDKTSLVKKLNDSRVPGGLIDDKGNILYWNIALLDQINSSIFEEPIATEAFSFEQLFEIVSVRDNEMKFQAIVRNPASKEILKSIGKDAQCWQAKLQYLMDLDFEKQHRIIEDFGIDGSNLVDKEMKRRAKLLTAMKKGYFEDDEYGIIDCEINPSAILSATFGITSDEAKELIKKYSIDIDKLDIQNEEEKKIQRKLQIIREIVSLKDLESCEDYYNTHKDELLKISQEVTPFYEVELEKDFLDLFGRQYNRSLMVEADRKEDVTYNETNIKVHEVSGDFTILIRGEQNVSKDNSRNFWNSTKVGVKGSCQNTIAQDYIRTVNFEGDDICYIASTSCEDGELRMASTTNIKSKEANVALSNIGIKSDFGNGVIFRIPQEQINHSRVSGNETITTREDYTIQTVKNKYIAYIQDTNDVDINKDPRFQTAQFAASQTGWDILIIPREKCALREKAKLEELKNKLLGKKERTKGETDESIIKELVVKFNNNREGILTSKGLKEKYFTEAEHIELVGTVNARLSQLKASNPKQYEELSQTVSEVYKDEISKYYAFVYDRDDIQKEVDIDATREHLKPYEDFLIEHERNLFELSDSEKDNIYSYMRNITQTSYYDMNKYHSLNHIYKVVMFSGILAKNENLSTEETAILLAAAAFHDSGREGNEGEDDNHAVASARQIKKYFEQNPDNPFGITQENISIIQAIIEYHEHHEPEKGVADIDKLDTLASKYQIDDEKFASFKKLSELLKDADALDRARFGKMNENRWSLDAKYLKSETAKSISMIKFAEECNFKFFEEEQSQEDSFATISEDVAKGIFENELCEFNRPKIQISSVKQITSTVPAVNKKAFMNILKDIKTTVKKFLKILEDKE